MNAFQPLLRHAIVVGAFLLSAAAYAQAVDASAPPPVASPGLKSPPMGPPPLPGARIEAELAYIKTALKVTDAQSRLWDRVADVLREQAKRRDADMAALRAARENDGKSGKNPVNHTFVAELETLQRFKTVEADDAGKLLAVVKPLYAALGDDQKTIADEMLRPGPGGPHGFGPRGIGMPFHEHGPMGPPRFPCDHGAGAAP